MCDVPLHTRRIEGTVTLVVSCFAAVTSSFCHWGNPGAGLLDSGQKVIRHRLVLQGLEECKRKAVADHGRGSQYCPRLFVYLPHGFLRQPFEFERPQPKAQQFLHGSHQRGIHVGRTVAISPDDDHRQMPDPIGKIMHQRQGGLVSPLQIVEDEKLVLSTFRRLDRKTSSL